MIEKYAEFVGEQEIDAIYKLAQRLSDLSILHVNSTAAGGRRRGDPATDDPPHERGWGYAPTGR